MPKVELNSVEDYYQQHKNDDEERLNFYKRVFVDRLKASYQMMYKPDKFIAEYKDDTMELFHKVGGKNEDTNGTD